MLCVLLCRSTRPGGLRCPKQMGGIQVSIERAAAAGSDFSVAAAALLLFFVSIIEYKFSQTKCVDFL